MKKQAKHELNNAQIGLKWGQMGRPKMTKRPRTLQKRPFREKLRILMVLGTIGSSTGRFLGHFGSDLGIQKQEKTPSSESAKRSLQKMLKLWPKASINMLESMQKSSENTYGFRMCQTLKKHCKTTVKTLFLRD